MALLDFVHCTLRALRPCDPRHHYDYIQCVSKMGPNGRTDGKLNLSRIAMLLALNGGDALTG